MQKQLSSVELFHTVFGHPVGNVPKLIEPTRVSLRSNLLQEENEEYLDACAEGNIVEVADALGDMLYILCGTIIEHGLQDKIEEVFSEIQRSNMSKLGEDGNPIYRHDGKILKGDNYFKPNISVILENDSDIDKVVSRGED